LKYRAAGTGGRGRAGARVKAESEQARLLENAEKYASEGKKLVDNASALQQALNQTTETETPVGGKLNGQWAKLAGQLDESKSTLVQANLAVKMAQEEYQEKRKDIDDSLTAWFIEHADLTPVTEAIQAGTVEAGNRAAAISNLNAWMERIESAKKRGGDNAETRRAAVREIVRRENYREQTRHGNVLYFYAERKNQPWLKDLLDKVEAIERGETPSQPPVKRVKRP